MPFVHQTPNANDCGAFCISYYHWLKRAASPTATFPNPPAANDGTAEYVAHYYNMVQFQHHDWQPSIAAVFGQETANLLATYSSPVLMMQQLNNPVFYLHQLQPAESPAKHMVTNIHAELQAQNMLGGVQIVNGNIPTPNANGQAAIGIYDNGGGGLHYVLSMYIDGQLRYFDPANGDGAAPLNPDLTHTLSGIFLP